MLNLLRVQRRWIALAILVALLWPLPSDRPVTLAAEHGGGHGGGEEEKEEEGVGPLAKLAGHTEIVYVALYTPDAQKLVSAGADKTIRIWDASQILTREQKKKRREEAARAAREARKNLPWFWKRWWERLFGKKSAAEQHSAPAAGEHASANAQSPVEEHHSAVQPESQHQAVAAAGSAPQPSLWKRLLNTFSSTKELRMAVPTPPPTPAPQFTPLPAPSVAPSKELLRTVSGYPGQVLTLTVTPDGKTIIAGGDTPLIQFFDLDTGQLLKTWRGHRDDVRSLALSPDGRLLASASADETIRIWDMAGGKTVKVLNEKWLTYITFSHNGRLLAAASGDPPGFVTIWEVAGWRRRFRLNTHSDLVYWVAFSQDDQWFASAGEVQKVWESASGNPVMIDVSLLELASLDSIVQQAQEHAEGGGKIPGAGEEEAPTTTASTKPLELRGHDKYAITVAISSPIVFDRPPAPKKKRPWFFKRLWNRWFATNPPPPEPDPTPPPPRTMPLIATGSIDDTIRIWDPTAGNTLAVLKGHKGHISSVSFNSDGALLVSTSWDKTIRIWDVMKQVEPKIKEKLDRDKLEQLAREMRAKQKRAAEEKGKARKSGKKRFWLF